MNWQVLIIAIVLSSINIGAMREKEKFGCVTGFGEGECYLTRTVYCKALSFHHLNGEQPTLQEISELFEALKSSMGFLGTMSDQYISTGEDIQFPTGNNATCSIGNQFLFKVFLKN